MSSQNTEDSDLRDIERLIETKRQNEEEVAAKIASLTARLSLLEEAVGKTADRRRQQETADRRRQTAADEPAEMKARFKVPRLAGTFIREYFPFVLFFAFFAALFLGLIFASSWLFEWQNEQRQDPTTVTVQPETETLDAFVAREAGALTSDERRKLMGVTEKILADHFDTPAAMREEFRFERLKAGLQSPGFEAFAERWAAKVEATNPEDSIAAMQSIYESLLRGLKVQAYEELEYRIQELEERREE